ncbi:MerR family transcriptional regulator [Nonomuraea sp. NPDC050783]|uniref:helix-turn-helix domain-containing protein n=1 Tax=Nonomuraea sp. NPDC050783 TaxID=3154634 RepID=UPI0034671C80
MSETWTIGELAEHAARALREGAAPAGGPPNGRVRDVPGERLIRWYTTIGLLDPPLARRGRVARYGRRHLLQLVAVKRLQAAGLSIADIQAALAGATDRTLEETAAVPASALTRPDTPAPAPSRPGASAPAPPRPGGPAAAPPRPSVPAGVPPRAGAPAARADLAPAPDGAAGRARFWAQRPAAPAGHGGPALDRPDVVTGIGLGNGVRLVWDGGRVPSEEDVQAVLAAAGPLLAVLEERELL